MRTCKALMIQGTASNVGKSIAVTALCRIFSEMGVRVAPFKAQNMALNSYVTRDGKEIGRAQAVQAEAAGIVPLVEMNPVLLKPTTDSGSQVIFMGKPVGNHTAREYYAMKQEALQVVRKAYESLCRQFDLIVIEGAGSPAEINLTEHDIVNMRMAEMADAPVLLVADIDRGGVFASLIGTMNLLPDSQNERIKGFLINKFRGDVTLLEPGLEEIHERTGRPVLGVLPYMNDIHIEEEDSLALSEKRGKSGIGRARVKIGVVRLPRLSNYTDMDPLEKDPNVDLIYFDKRAALHGLSAVILPGSKDTIGDLLFLKEAGLAQEIREFAQAGGEVVGLCGGYQMLGELVEDPHSVENKWRSEPGLGLLPICTVLEKEKLTAQVLAVSRDGLQGVSGYEIHMGKSLRSAGCRSIFWITERNGRLVDEEDGACNSEGNVWGTYIHGLFENPGLRRRFLDRLRDRGGDSLSTEILDYEALKSEGYDRLAQLFRDHVEMEAICDMVGLPVSSRTRLT